MINCQRKRELFRTFRAWAVLVAAVTWSITSAVAEQKVALVIGNSTYPSSPLRNPVNDANAMAEKLKSLGFEVIVRTDANLRDMTRAFSQFGQKLTPGSVSLFYYAGHGVQVRGKNYLVPVDAEIDNEASVTTESVDVDQLLNQLGPARLSMVILDACRNNPFERRFRTSGGGGLAQIDAPTGTMLAYATAPGKVASDGSGLNGLYTEALLKALDMPGLKVEDVFKQVRINVVKASNGSQTPWESSSLTGEFYFRSPATSVLSNTNAGQYNDERMLLARALDEERAKREKESETVRLEMDKLRTELQRATQLALVAPASVLPRADRTTFAAEWAPRVSLLEKNLGQLTLSKAAALLLDISSENDLKLLLSHESEIKGKQWSLAHALGVDPAGHLIWGGAYRMGLTHVAQTALEQCAHRAADSCKVVILNSDFRETIFIEVAKTLGGQSVAAVRQAYLRSLNKPRTESEVGSSGGQTNYMMFPIGYSSKRD